PCKPVASPGAITFRPFGAENSGHASVGYASVYPPGADTPAPRDTTAFAPAEEPAHGQPTRHHPADPTHGARALLRFSRGLRRPGQAVARPPRPGLHR